MKKRFLTMMTAAALSVAMATTAFAAGWQKNDTGWWYGTNADNSAWHANGWQWIDGNGDGTAECYWFDHNGYMAENTTTPDGYTVNADGAWTVNGAVQTKAVQTTQTAQQGELSAEEILAYLCKDLNGSHSNGHVTWSIENGKVKANKWYKDGWMWYAAIDYGAGAFTYALALDENGYLMTNATTPDGYQTNQYGQLVIDGQVVAHDSGCKFFGGVDLYDKTGALITDKNAWPLDRVDMSPNILELSNYFYSIMPFGKLIYNHVSGPSDVKYQYGHNYCVDQRKSGWVTASQAARDWQP